MLWVHFDKHNAVLAVNLEVCFGNDDSKTPDDGQADEVPQ